MAIGRFIGWLLLLAALAVLGRDLVAWHGVGAFHPISLGQLWFDIDSQSLLLVQPAIQRHVAPWLWDPVIQDFLLCWAVLVFAVPGLLLLLLFRRRTEEGYGFTRRHRRRRR